MIVYIICHSFTDSEQLRFYNMFDDNDDDDLILIYFPNHDDNYVPSTFIKIQLIQS